MNADKNERFLILSAFIGVHRRLLFCSFENPSRILNQHRPDILIRHAGGAQRRQPVIVNVRVTSARHGLPNRSSAKPMHEPTAVVRYQNSLRVTSRPEL